MNFKFLTIMILAVSEYVVKYLFNTDIYFQPWLVNAYKLIHVGDHMTLSVNW